MAPSNSEYIFQLFFYTELSFSALVVIKCGQSVGSSWRRFWSTDSWSEILGVGCWVAGLWKAAEL